MAPTDSSLCTAVEGGNGSLPSSLDHLKVLIAHDWLVAWAGAERCLEEMLQVFPQAHVVAGVLHPSIRDLNSVTRRARETWLGRIPGARTHHRWFLPLEAAAFATFDTRDYDLVISSSHALAKAVGRRGGAQHLCYCYSPPRYLWDLFEVHREAARGMQRVALSVAATPLRIVDRWAARRVDRFVAISAYVSDRVRRWYGRNADVVYPPVRVKPISSAATARRDRFLLYLGRLVPYKRVDLAIGAAERLGVPLVVAGDGPERKQLEALKGKWTEFVGSVSEVEAGNLLSSCAAFVFCAEEDFGIAPLEANAHGAPVVAYARGGVLETMIPGATAELFENQTIDAIASAIRRALERGWDRDALRANALRFSPERFRRGIQRVAAGLLSGRASGRDLDSDVSYS